jgi:hypothetical protein
MLTILGFIPVIGPIIQAVAGVFTSYFNAEVQNRQTDASVANTAIKASAETTIAYQHDWGVQLCRDIVMLPGSVWCSLYLWDKTIAHHYPWLVFDVAPLDGPLAAMPMALLTFFFGLAAMNIWKFK